MSIGLAVIILTATPPFNFTGYPVHCAKQANFVSGAVGCASLDRQQLCDLVDLLTESLSDNNHKVSQTALQVLSFLVKTESDTIKPYANAIVPLVVRLVTSINGFKTT
jgi:hypothetical protein